MRDWALQRSWTILLSAVLAASFVFNIVQSDGYLSVDNFVNLFELSIEKIIVVIAMTFVIISGEIDLSVASVMGFAACIVAALHERSGLPFGLIVVIALLVSAMVGLLQGGVITKLGLPSLVVTLAGLIAWRGAARSSSKTGRSATIRGGSTRSDRTSCWAHSPSRSCCSSGCSQSLP